MKIKSIRLKTGIDFLIASLISILFTTAVMSIFIHYRFQSFALVWSTVLLLALGAAVVAFAASWYLSRRLTMPINQMIEMAYKIGQGDFDHRLLITSGDEVQDLADNLNSMASQLGDRIREAREEKAKLVNMLADIADGVVVTDSTGRIELFNPKAEKVFAISAKDAIGRTIIEISQSYQLQDLIASALRGENLQSEEELSFPRRRILKIKAGPLRGATGQIFGTITTLEDVTKFRQLQKARRDFTANVSHELRTPVASINALTESLIAGAKDDPGKSSEFLEKIHKETERLTSLINDILDLARLESPEAQIKQDEVNLGDLGMRAIEGVRSAACQKSLEMGAEGFEGRTTIKGDYDQLMLATSNLLDNAVRYTAPGGRIDLKLSEDERAVKFSVSDTGIGIPSKDIPRIFERFYVVDRARSRESGGTGLGLSIVKHVIEKHGGKVKVKSVLGEGSEFTVVLPKR